MNDQKGQPPVRLVFSLLRRFLSRRRGEAEMGQTGSGPAGSEDAAGRATGQPGAAAPSGERMWLGMADS